MDEIQELIDTYEPLTQDTTFGARTSPSMPYIVRLVFNLKEAKKMLEEIDKLN